MPQNTADDAVRRRDAPDWAGVPSGIAKYVQANPLPPYQVFSEVVGTTLQRILHELRSRYVEGSESRVDIETLAAFARALALAAEQFVNEVRGTSTRSGSPASLAFCELGFAQAVRGKPLSPLLIGMALVVRRAWHAAFGWAVRRGWDSAGMEHLSGAALSFIGHLEEQMDRGYQTGLLVVTDAAETTDGVPPGSIRVSRPSPFSLTQDFDVSVVDDPSPGSVVIMRVAFHGTFPDAPRMGRALVLGSVNPALVLVPAEHAEPFAQALVRSPGLRVAMSWPVPAAQAGTANRWASRALELVDKAVIPRAPIVRCDDHAVQLWLHAEPQVRRRLVQRYLGPLLTEGRHSREILGETMLAWVATHDRPPAIAAKLGVHPHTVRYRMKRISQLFGDSLDDPEFVEATSILLRATVPLWKAGDDSDVREYRARLRQR